MIGLILSITSCFSDLYPVPYPCNHCLARGISGLWRCLSSHAAREAAARGDLHDAPLQVTLCCKCTPRVHSSAAPLGAVANESGHQWPVARERVGRL